MASAGIDGDAFYFETDYRRQLLFFARLTAPLLRHNGNDQFRPDLSDYYSLCDFSNAR